MSDEKMREEFERSYQGSKKKRKDGEYAIPSTRNAFVVWQASSAHSAARIAELEGQVAMLRDAGDHVIENLGNQYHTNGGSDFYQIRHEVIAVLGEALDDATAQTAEEYRKRVQSEAIDKAVFRIVMELEGLATESAMNQVYRTGRNIAAELRNPAAQAEGKGEK